MIKVLVYGVNPIAIIVDKLIDKNKVKIVAYTSTDCRNIGKFINGVEIIDYEKKNTIEYDIIIFTDSNSNNCNKGINLYEYIIEFYDYQVYKSFYNIDEAIEDVYGIATGLSHIQVGIDEDVFDYNFLNLAISSQDIFYDYEAVKYVLNSKKYNRTLKLALIGLTYYSFEYDLSKSINKNRVYYYYLFNKKIHNKIDEYSICDKIEKFEEVAEDIFIKDYKFLIFNTFKSINENNWIKMTSGNIDENKIKMGTIYSKGDSKKDYPETRIENRNILIKLIRLLKKNDIKPIIIIAPQTKYYTEKLSKDLKNRFEHILNNIAESEDVQVLNYFHSDIFDDNDYYDVAHLNRIGAKKFTQLIREKIEIENIVF